ncbi:MAG: WG repeat-containing protein, partial [Bacteroidia bacterium]|nr:WG repeat-containing protein [Bacteroidia bacterium]
DYKGQIILPPVFEKLGDFENHRAYYVENNLYGIVWDNSKKYPAKYQWISTFYGNIAIVKQNNLYGLINDNNEIVLNAEYDLIFHCNEDIYMVIKNKKYGFFNSKKLCFEYFIQYDYIKNTDPKTYYHENYFKLMLQNKAFLGNSNGMAVNKKPFQDIILSKDFIFIKNNNQWKILYANNNLSTYNFNYFSICNNQTIIAQVSDHFVIIDKAANIKYKTKNKLSYIYKNYYFEQIDDEKGIIIDTTGKLIYSDVENYKVFEKYLIVTKPDKTVKVIE